MSSAGFWRCVWKEYRTQRPFWAAMLGLALAAQGVGLGCWLCGLVATSDVVYRVALAMAALYALGCGGTLFVAEYEAQTYRFQQQLPIRASWLFWSKIAFALGSTAAWSAAAWLAAAMLTGWRLPPRPHQLALWGLWGMAALELLAWGVFFSLLTTRSLAAVILAVGTAALSGESLGGGHWARWSLEHDVAALPTRAGIVALVALLDVRLGVRWFREPRPLDPSARWRLGAQLGRLAIGPVWHFLVCILRIPCRTVWPTVWRSGQSRPSTGGTTRARSPLGALNELGGRRARSRPEISGWTVFGRLVWQHAGQSAPLLLTFVALATPMALLRLGSGIDPGLIDRFSWNLWPVWFGCVGLALAVPPLLGSWVFAADQHQKRFRFLAERGVEPNCVWLSRHVVAGVPLAIGTLALLCPTDAHDDTPVLYLFGYAFVGYACGQFFSMFVSSGILAALLGGGSTAAVCLWAGLMHTIELSWWWSVAPLPVALLVATWLRTGDWMAERSGPRALMRAIGPVGLTAVAVLVAVPVVRVYEVPSVDPGFSPVAYARPRNGQEEATRAVYRRAIDSVRTEPTTHRLALDPPPSRRPLDDSEKAWLKANEPALALVLEAGRQSACDFFDPTWADTLPQHVVRLARWLVPSARLLEAEGQLDAALDRYLAALAVAGHLRRRINWPLDGDDLEMEVYQNLPYWAAQPGQSSGRILSALDRLDHAIAQLPSRTDPIKSYYLAWQRCLGGDPQALACFIRDERELRLMRVAMRCLFWEQARALRVLNLWSADTLQTCAQAEAAAAAGQRIDWPPSCLDPHARWHRLARTTLWSPPASVALVVQEGLTRLEMQRRATRLLLALAAWKIDHGSLPGSIEPLAGHYLGRLPVEPISGQPFDYYPRGVSCSFHDREGSLIGPRQPFLWTRWVPTHTNNPRDHSAWEPRAADNPSASATDLPKQVLRLGRAFLIPQ